MLDLQQIRCVSTRLNVLAFVSMTFNVKMFSTGCVHLFRKWCYSMVSSRCRLCIFMLWNFRTVNQAQLQAEEACVKERCIAWLNALDRLDFFGALNLFKMIYVEHIV